VLYRIGFVLVLFSWLTLQGCNSETPATVEVSQGSNNSEMYQPSSSQMRTDPMEPGVTGSEKKPLKSIAADGPQKISRESGSSETVSVDNWRQLYDLSYTIKCIDDRLGASTTRQFQTGERAPTDAERQVLEGCNMQSDLPRSRSSEGDDLTIQERVKILKDSGSWIKTGNPKDDQFVLGYVPTAAEWRCGVEAVGASVLRDIKSGNHTITEEEEENLSPCFRASPDSLIHPLATVWEGHCIPLDVFLEFLDYYRPSWEQLDCHLAGLERQSMPDQVRYVQVSDPFGIRNGKGVLAPAHWDRIMSDSYYEDLDLNFSPSMANMSMPPSYDEEHNSIKCHSMIEDNNGPYKTSTQFGEKNWSLEEYWIDEAMRGAAVGWIIEKKKGRRIYADTTMCTNDYVVQGNLADYLTPPITSVQDFKDRTLKIVMPAYAIRAKAAEKVKAEMMQLNGLQAEIEVIFTKEEFLWELPTSEQVSLAQWYMDTVIPVVREHFSGTIWVDSNIMYTPSNLNPTYGAHWRELSFAEFDHVSFTLDGTCDFVEVNRYFDSQFDAIMSIVKRDKITWSAIVGIPKDKHGPLFRPGCRPDIEEREVEMWESVYSKLDALDIQPYFLSIPQPPRSWTKDQEGYSPTSANSDRGNWKLFSLDQQEDSYEVQQAKLDYSHRNILP